MAATVELPVDPRVTEFIARRWQLLIDGEWVKAKSEQTFHIFPRFRVQTHLRQKA